MNFQDVKAQTSPSNVFSKIDLLGAFCFDTAIVTLDSLEARHLEEIQRQGAATGGGQAVSTGQYEALARVLPLAAHEYTHFVDATSTVWGLRHLQMMDKAYQCDDRRGGQERNFGFAKSFQDHCRSIRLPAYYTMVSDGDDSVRPWKSQISMGRLFSSNGELSARPVLFSRFANAKDAGLARSPISMVSLLEASAMFQELGMQAALITSCEDNYRIVEQRRFTERVIGSIYDKRLTEYSVCAHVVANRLNCIHVETALAYCTLLTRLCLNATQDTFAQLGARAPVAEVLEIPRESEFVAGLLTGLRQGDRSILFYLLSQALPVDSVARGEPIVGVSAAAAVLGINVPDLVRAAQDEATSLVRQMESSPIRPIATLARAGLDNMRLITFDVVPLNFAKLHLPPALFGDSSVANVFQGNQLANFDISASFDELCRGLSWVNRFSEACVF